MKKVLLTLCLLFSTYSMALEIQCRSSVENVDIVVKTSPDSGFTYLLFLQGDAVSPMPMEEENLNITSQDVDFKNNDISLHLSRSESNGLIILENQQIILTECIEY